MELSPVQRGDHLLALRRLRSWRRRCAATPGSRRSRSAGRCRRRSTSGWWSGGPRRSWTSAASTSSTRTARCSSAPLPGRRARPPRVTGVGRDDWVERRAEVEPLLQAALALLDRWAERGLDRRGRSRRSTVDVDYGTTLWAGADGLEIRLGHGALPDKLARLEQRARGGRGRGTARGGAPPRQPAAPGLGRRAAGDGGGRGGRGGGRAREGASGRSATRELARR